MTVINVDERMTVINVDERMTVINVDETMTVIHVTREDDSHEMWMRGCLSYMYED